ncbi:MAG: hypothetical protein A2V93_00630 [Ignavibacteria bacterium RBG_16_34_14]|nr:MAG: hypothetical protein A2V93_00630 [Ignavibacteria bacterium RBG_16_34_14]
MVKSSLSVLIFSLLYAAFSGFSVTDSENNLTLKSLESSGLGVGSVYNFSIDTSEIPEEISFPSSVGKVVFPHQLHIEDLEIECVECHHQINAKELKTPHFEYFKSSWIKCEICHTETEQVKQKVFNCSECHHSSPANIADETLSSKVVIHKSCWECHEVGTGSDASETCSGCHSGDNN